MTISFECDGAEVEVADNGRSLLEVLRDELGINSLKDGCSPQGQCGCCTVLIDGAARVACVTPARRVRGRAVTTLDGLDSEEREAWAAAFTSCGASQCGFCTPGIILRYAALRSKEPDASTEKIHNALAAHLCRCTGWQTIVEAWDAYGGPSIERDLTKAAERARLEGHTAQQVGAGVASGQGGFADDSYPEGALVAVRSSEGWATGESLLDTRRAAGKVQGRRTTAELSHPLELPPGEWAITLATTWVEPAYLETDASWAAPGGTGASPLGNGGAFGGKIDSPVSEVAVRLADEHDRPVRALFSREDTVRFGPKRPPIAAGINPDGTGIIRVVATDGIADAIRSIAPDLVVEEVDVNGLNTSSDIRGAGWVEASILLAAARGAVGTLQAPGGGSASVEIVDETIRVWVDAGRALDAVVLRSYCIGAAHMAYSWVTSEGLVVDEAGEVHDLTVRSFGIVKASEMPRVEIEIAESDSEPTNGSDAVFAAVAAAVWIDRGLPPRWPTDR